MREKVGWGKKRNMKAWDYCSENMQSARPRMQKNGGVRILEVQPRWETTPVVWC